MTQATINQLEYLRQDLEDTAESIESINVKEKFEMVRLETAVYQIQIAIDEVNGYLSSAKEKGKIV